MIICLFAVAAAAAAAVPEASHISLDSALAIIATVLAVGGIVLAVRHDNEMKQQIRKMEQIFTSIPTRALASRADHLRFIGALIEKTTNGELKVLTDCSDYGSFFDPNGHERVFEALVGAQLRGVNVRILVGGPLRHITGASEFADQDFEEMRRKDRRFTLRLRTYLEYLRAEADMDGTFARWLSDMAKDDAKRSTFRQWLLVNEAKGPGAEELSDESLQRNLVTCLRVYASKRATLKQGQAAVFQTLLWSREKFFEEQLLQRAHIRVQRVTSLRPTIFFWLRDDADEPVAAFMFAQSDREAPGSAMTTVDPNFLGSFRATFDRDEPAVEPSSTAPA